MGSMGLLGIACAEQDMNALYQLHHSSTYSLSETIVNEEWKEKQDYFFVEVVIAGLVVGLSYFHIAFLALLQLEVQPFEIVVVELMVYFEVVEY